MGRSQQTFTGEKRFWRLSLFEKVILVNTLMLVGEAILGFWLTSHALENRHYLIDTAFIVGATVLSLCINFLLLRASFQPLFSLLATIRSISAGQIQARASTRPADTEIGELAQAFNSMLDQLDKTRREQAMLILQTQEEERRRVALELHDESSQNLTALLVHTEFLQQALQTLPASALTSEARELLSDGLQQLTHVSQHTLESVRTLALQLRPAVLDDLGLHAALRWLAEDCRTRFHIQVEVTLPVIANTKSSTNYPALYETTLFRVAQESLTNVARHAQASHVSITLQQNAQQIELRICDNGQGYEATQSHAGLGISGMRERVALLNGTFSLTSATGQGTTIVTTLPLLATVKDEIYASR